MTTRCPACGQEAPSPGPFCPACGAALSAGATEQTAAYPSPSRPAATTPSPPAGGRMAFGEGQASDTGWAAETAARFAPGQTLAARYRIITLLGKGGMGEVYRADDLRLGQPAALKFLPAHLTADPERLARFHNEVRVARRITHPNVCRVYDIGEADGQPFLSMEYVDGEELATLLRRIGRFPEDKAVELARQLCAGLEAAHEMGVLHRDLKPQNVMIDGKGQIRIMDFGLAGHAGSFQGAEIRAGTPAYQAPEQAAGQEVTVQSDLYALGLVLYEMFTGKKPFEADRRPSSARPRPGGTPAAPSSHVSGLNPAVEQVILRCLDGDPARRPRSAAAVAAALPGGDPLVAALAAGETPSPQTVARAGGEGSLRPAVAHALLVVALAGLALAAWLNGRVALFRQVPGELSPRELGRQAREVLRQFGHTESGDSARGIATDDELLAHLAAVGGPGRWEGLRTGQPAVMYFWYRQGPQPLVQRLTPNDTTGWTMPGRVRPNEPPLSEPGMACVFLDLDGRLLELHAVPPRTATDAPSVQADWRPLLALARLEGVRPAEPRRVPRVFADERAAWEGHYPERPDLPVRVEAAALDGRPVYFHVGPDGARERLHSGPMPGGIESLADLFYGWLGLVALPVGGWMAWKNWRAGRANPAGASWLVGAFVAFALAGWLLAAKHVPSPGDEVALFAGMLGRALVEGMMLWLAYLALEPWVRRRSPWRFIAWSRLLEGTWRDPLVGREVLFGVVGGAVAAVLARVLSGLPGWLGGVPCYRPVWDATFTEGAGDILLTAQFALQVALRDFFFYFVLFLVARRDWLAAGLALVIWVGPFLLGGERAWLEALVNLSFYALGLSLLLRFGFLAYVAYNFTGAMLKYLPVTVDLSAWYAGISSLSLLTLAALAVYGFCCARGRPLVGASD